MTTPTDVARQLRRLLGPVRLPLLLALAACRTTSDAVREDPPADAGAAATPVPPPAEEPPLRLTIVGTNDLHGWLMPQQEKFPTGTVSAGGVAALSGYLKVLRAQNPGGVVLVDAGDMFQGTLVSNVTEGETVIEAMNLLGYDLAAIGNHEFDYGPVGPYTVPMRKDQDPFGALKARIRQARFPLLSANTYEKATSLRPGWLPGDGTLLLERHGVRVGLVGLTTTQTPTTTLPVNVASLRFDALGPQALAASQRLRQRGAEVVVVVAHAGGRCTDASNPRVLDSCDLDQSEVFEMVKSLPAGAVDVVVAGHTHAQVGHFVNGTAVIESLALGKAFGLVELELDPRTHLVRADRTRITSAIPVCGTMDATSGGCDLRALKKNPAAVKVVPARFRGQEVEIDAAVEAVLAPALARVNDLQLRPLGIEAMEDFTRNYEAESPLGNLLADALRAVARADMALVNPGGLRADLKHGPLTYGSVFEVLPFDNTVATVTVTADQLWRLLSQAYAARKGVFQLAGVEVTIDRCPGPDRLKKVQLPGGRKLDPSRRYTVAMPDFLARGGDGLGPALASLEPTQIDLGETRGNNVRDEMVALWQRSGKALRPAPLGRVTLVGDGPCNTLGSGP